MRDTLLLRAESVAGDSWRWLRLEADGRPRGGIHAGSLADAASEAGGLRVVVLVPAADCLLTTVQVPGRNRQKLLRAVPYALEEQLSDEVEKLHFALGDALDDGGWPVAVISRQVMDRLVDALDATDMDVQQLVPDVLAIPRRDKEISALVVDDVVLVRKGRAEGYVVDSDNLDMLLAMQGEADEVPALRLFVAADMSPPGIDNWPGETHVETWSSDPLNLYAVGLGSRPLNLLQGPYSKAGEWERIWKPWRATAALLVAGVLVSFAAMVVDYYRLSAETEQLQAQIEETFRKASPETKRVVNPRVQMQQKLDSLQKGGADTRGFLALLGKTGKVLKDIKDVELGGITYRAGRLDVDLKIGNLQMLDQLKQALTGNGDLKVEIQSATTGADQRVQGRMRIQGVGT
jgi:general secretion pathway protein L